jgi:NIMA (never in mitosis gene a)-related kinase
MHWDRMSAGLTGYSSAEAIGHLLQDFVSPEYRSLTPRAIKQVLSERKPRNNLEITLTTKLGGCVDVILSIALWIDTRTDKKKKEQGGGAGSGGSGVLGVLIAGSQEDAHFGQRYRLIADNANEIFKWVKGKAGDGGSFGRVFLARRFKDNQVVAIKKVDMNGLKREAREKIQKEPDILQSLHHPNIISYIETFVECNELHIVMEFADGGNLRVLVQKQAALPTPVPLEDAIVMRWFAQLVLSVQYLHKQKLIHRDIKCLNVFLTSSHEVKLGDFGHCTKLIDGFAHTTCGTPETMSPEMVLGCPYDSKADTWAVGCVLYELMMLHRPFDGLTVHELLAKVCRADYDPLPDTMNSDIRLLIGVMLTADPRNRPTMTELEAFPAVKAATERHQKTMMAPRQKTLVDVMRQSGAKAVTSKASLNSPALRDTRDPKLGPALSDAKKKNNPIPNLEAIAKKMPSRGSTFAAGKRGHITSHVTSHSWNCRTCIPSFN